MCRQTSWFLAVLSVLLIARVAAVAAEPPAFMYVAEWEVARDQWAAFTAFWDKNYRPLLERRLADGTILAWGAFEAAVHTEGGATHGVWWEAASLVAIEHVREELVKLPANPATAGAKHHDHLLRALVHRASATSPTTGYLWVAAVLAQPDKIQQYREALEKYEKPIYEGLLPTGTILKYAFAIELVHTGNPNWHFIFYVTPDAAAQGKVSAAIAALFAGRAPGEDVTVGDAIAAVSVRSEHRDLFARLIGYAHK